jgi:hypothetical protein
VDRQRKHIFDLSDAEQRQEGIFLGEVVNEIGAHFGAVSARRWGCFQFSEFAKCWDGESRGLGFAWVYSATLTEGEGYKGESTHQISILESYIQEKPILKPPRYNRVCDDV